MMPLIDFCNHDSSLAPAKKGRLVAGVDLQPGDEVSSVSHLLVLLLAVVCTPFLLSPFGMWIRSRASLSSVLFFPFYLAFSSIRICASVFCF